MNDSELILCSGIKLDKNYENVLSYNEESMVNLCRNNAIYTGTNYKFVDNSTNRIKVSAEYKDVIFANYMAFINPRFGNKWFFAWITNVKLLAPATCEITFKVDVFSTWYSRFNVGEAFIEREHVSDDTIGKHTIPENLELGEYVTQYINNTQEDPELTNMSYLSDTVIIAAVTTTGLSYTIPQRAQQSEYNGIYSGLYYLAFKTPRDFNLYLYEVHQNISEDNIASLFIVPTKLCQFVTSDWDNTSFDFEFAFVPTSTTEVDMGDIVYTKPDHLDQDYFPINKKLLTWPYCYLNITNNAGTVCDYHYELFKDQDCPFNIKGSLGVGCSIKMYPYDYATGNSTDLLNKLYSISANKLPTCTWLNDTYTNWLTSQAVNLPLQFTKDIANIGLGFALGSPSGMASGLFGIASSMATVYERSLIPPTARGGSNEADLSFAQKHTFNIYPMSIKKEMAQCIDGYFSRFGYKVNIVETPNLNSRTKFNFIKVGGMDELISGNIPAVDLEEINSIFRKGVTIFHNYNDIGNYTINNPIVTP